MTTAIEIRACLDPSEISISDGNEHAIVVGFGPHATSVELRNSGESEVSIQNDCLSVIQVSASIPAVDLLGIETGPVFSYTAGLLTLITYDSGNTKTFSYASGKLTQIDYTVGATVKRKAFVYAVDGSLSEIVETVL